jgi:uncharacterized protein YraI
MLTNANKHSDNFATLRRLLATTAVFLSIVATPSLSVAQTTAIPVYAVSELNLRKGPGSNDAIFTVVPLGAELQRRDGEITNEYAPVVYNGITGWVIDAALVATPEEVELANASPTPQEPLELFASDARVTLAPLMLRSAPDVEAEPIAGMPEGSLVTLTQEGWENGYVAVDYGGAQGWAFADFLAEPTTTP